MAETNNQLPFRQLILQYTTTAVNILFPLLLFPYMTRTLAPEGYGILGYYESLLNVVVVLGAFGVQYFGLRQLSKYAIGDTDQANTVLHLVLINLLMSILGTIGYLLYEYARPVTIGNNSIRLMYAYTMLIYALHIDWYFQSQEKFQLLLKRTLLIRLISLVAAFIVVRKPEDLIYYILIGVLNYTLVAAVSFHQIYKLLPFWNWNVHLFRKLLKALWPFALIGIFSSFYIEINTIILSKYSNLEMLGHYSVAAKIVRIGLNLFTTASIVLFVKLFRTNINRQLQGDSLLLTFHLSFPIAAVLYFFSQPLILFVSGEQYLAADIYLKIFSLLWLIVPLHYFISLQVLMAHHKEKLMLLLFIFISLFSVIINLLLIPFWMAWGAAIAQVAAEFLYLLLALFACRSYFTISKIQWVELLGCLLVFPIAYAGYEAAKLVSHNPFLQLLVGVSIVLLLHISVQYYLLKSRFWKLIWEAWRKR